MSLSRTTGAGAAFFARRGGDRFTLPVLSFVISVGMILVTVIAPDLSASAADTRDDSTTFSTGAQQMQHSGGELASVVRDSYGATSAPKAPVAAAPDPGTAKAIAYELLKARGWGDDEYGCLVALWERESHWNAAAHNPSSGAHGIPQALPGSKMASAGADWETNPATQITWGIGYIAGRYGTPCTAWDHSEINNWY